MILEITGFWLIVLAIIAFILIIGTIIALHELGHLFVAKKAGILCHEYSIGFGPVIYKHQFKETLFCIRAIPLGGYVSMAGEGVTSDLVKVGEEIGLNLSGEAVSEIILSEKQDASIRGKVVSVDLVGEDSNPLYITINDGLQDRFFNVYKDAYYIFDNGKKLQLEPYERTFDSKPWWQRVLTLFAGPFMNFILAMVIYFIVSFSYGVPNMQSNVIGSVSESYPVYGILEAGDIIKSINGKSVTSWTEINSKFDSEHSNYVTTYVITYIDSSDNNQEKTETFEAYTNITSIGLTNIGVSNTNRVSKTYSISLYDGTSTTTKDITGLTVGKCAIRYKGSEGNIKSNDIITSMTITTSKGKNVISGSDLTWSNIVKYLYESSDNDLPTINFEYYSYNSDNNYYTYVESSNDIEPYTHEVLQSQDVSYFRILIGISPSYHFDFFGCIGDAFSRFGSDFTIIIRTLKLLIWPSTVRQIGVSDLSSFVGIFAIIKTYIASGFLVLLAFMAMLSVNIGIMNLLPIPALDGGRIVFVLVEAITKKKVNKKVESIINTVFFILVLILLVYVTFNDVLRFF